MKERRPAVIRKSDLAPAFEAAKDAGYNQVSVVVETPEGQRFEITAATSVDASASQGSAFDKWEANRAS